jgi:hypothetical protein
MSDAQKDFYDFLTSESTQCPSWMPLQPDHTMLQTSCVNAIVHSQGQIPMTEFIRKEHFYNCFHTCETILGIKDEIFADEIRNYQRHYDYKFGTYMDKDMTKKIKITKGQTRRFHALIYLLTVKLLKACENILEQENKKRIMPRHLRMAAVITGTIHPFLAAEKYNFS